MDEGSSGADSIDQMDMSSIVSKSDRGDE